MFLGSGTCAPFSLSPLRWLSVETQMQTAKRRKEKKGQRKNQLCIPLLWAMEEYEEADPCPNG